MMHNVKTARPLHGNCTYTAIVLHFDINFHNTLYALTWSVSIFHRHIAVHYLYRTVFSAKRFYTFNYTVFRKVVLLIKSITVSKLKRKTPPGAWLLKMVFPILSPSIPHAQIKLLAQLWTDRYKINSFKV